MLPPGPGTPAEQVAENQRERLFGAMVTSASERGYVATRVAGLCQISGVSSRSFYDLFPDKQACLLATLEALLKGVARPGSATELAARMVEQPAAARLCLVEAFAAGPEAARMLDDALAGAAAGAMLPPGPVGEAMPARLVSALTGALADVARTRLLNGEERSLPAVSEELIELLGAYRPPTQPLRPGRRPPVKPEAPEAHDHAERALRAFEALLAEQGYVETTMEQVAKRAAMSPKTLYANFADKRELLLSAIDSAGAQIAAAVMPAFRRNTSWPDGVRAAIGGLLGLLASRPAMAHLITDGFLAEGPTAQRRRLEAVRPLWALLTGGRRLASGTPGIAPEAIFAAVFALCRNTVRSSGPEALPGLLPLATYLALAPFLGPEEATAVARGEQPDKQGARSRERERVQAESSSGSILVALTLDRTATAREIAEEIGRPAGEVAVRLEELFKVGIVQQVDERRGEDGPEPVYTATSQNFDNERWAQFSLEERRRLSTEVGERIAAEVDRSVETGTFDARVDRYLIRIPFWFDEEGWQEIGKVLETALAGCLEVQARANRRMKGTTAGAINARAVLALFEVPEPEVESEEG